MILTADGLPPVHYRDGRRVINSRDLGKFFGRPVNQLNTSIRARIVEGSISSSDVLITKATGLHRFDSYDLVDTAVKALITRFSRPGDGPKVQTLLKKLNNVDARVASRPEPAAVDPRDIISLRDGTTPIVNSNDLAMYHHTGHAKILQHINRVVRDNPQIRNSVWEGNLRTKGSLRSVDLAQPAYAALESSIRLYDGGHIFHFQALLQAFADRAAQVADQAKKPVHTAPTPSRDLSATPSLVEIDDNNHRVINSHTLSKLLDERHRVIRNKITEIAAHDIYFSRSVGRSGPRGELVGGTFNMDRDAAIRVVNAFGPTKRERAMPRLLLAFDGPTATLSATPTPPVIDAEVLNPVLDFEPTPEIMMTPSVTQPQSDQTPITVDDDQDLPATTSDRPIVFDRSGTLLTTSRDVAAYFGKNHFHVLRDIETIMEQAKDTQAPDLLKACFNVVNEPHPTIPTKLLRYIEMDERGVLILIGRFTGAKALEKQFAYAEEFRRMRELINGPATPASIDQMIADPMSFLKLFNAYAELSQRVRGPAQPSALPMSRGILDPPMMPRWPNGQGHNQQESDMSFTVAAHAINLSARQLTRALRQAQILTEDNKPTPQAPKGVFSTKTGRGFKGTDYTQTRVTPAGLQYLRDNADRLRVY